MKTQIEYEEIEARLHEAQWLLKNCRAILNSCGYIDAVNVIDEFLAEPTDDQLLEALGPCGK